MRIADSRVLMKYFDSASKSGNYDFYRCFECGRVVTRQREREVFNVGAMVPETDLRICGCGSMKYSPGWPTGLEWILPRVVKYTAKLFLVRVVAAWVDGRLPRLLPVIEWMVRDEWEDPTWQTTR